jgi:predicted nucleotidyltransferase
LFQKEGPPQVKPLLYVYRVLLTGIHLMRTGQIEANLITLNEDFRLPYIGELVSRKIHGAEKSKLETPEVEFYRAEYERLVANLEIEAAEWNRRCRKRPLAGKR